MVTYWGSYEEAPSGTPDLLPDEVLDEEFVPPPPACRLCCREEMVVEIEVPETYFDNGSTVLARYWPLCSGCLDLIDRRDSSSLRTRLDERLCDGSLSEESSAAIVCLLLDGVRHAAQ